MINLSIMPLNPNHIDEICADIIEQQKNGVSTHAMFMMKFQAECNPALDKATEQCKIYDEYRKRLDKAGAKHGVLVQSTLGHIYPPRELPPFTPATSIIDGKPMISTSCPLDPGFREYIKNQMKILAQHNPSMIMIDDDVALLYRLTKGCGCEHHMKEFNHRAGTDMSREELYAHTQGTTDEDKRYTDIYIQTVKDSLIGAVKAMREGIDEVNPDIQGVVSGIYVFSCCEFSGEISRMFAGKNNPAIMRYNGGPYSLNTMRGFTAHVFRAAILKANTKDLVDIYIAETDPCPHNRYSTSAALLHGHFTAIILEGASGAKHWITRLTNAYEPASGKAYRKILAKYKNFYEKMIEYTKELKPFGCRLPLTLMQNYDLVPTSRNENICPWSTCVLERLGLPVYYSNSDGGAVFLDDFSVDGFDDKQIKKFLSGTTVLSAIAADKLNKRGFGEYIGVAVSDWGDLVVSEEKYKENCFTTQYNKKRLAVTDDKTEVLSDVVRLNPDTGVHENVCPGVTRLENSLGGEVVVFGGSPDMPFTYYTAFSMLNETRKKQLTDILQKRNHIPLYYPEDGEIYLRAGTLNNGEIMAAFFNLGYDQLEDIPFVCDKPVSNVEILNPDGTRSKCDFIYEDGIVRVQKTLNTAIPAVLFIS